MKDICAYLEERRHCINGLIENLPYRQSLSHMEHRILCNISDILAVTILYLQCKEDTVEVDTNITDIIAELYATDMNLDIVLNAIVCSAIRQYTKANQKVQVSINAVEQYTSFVKKLFCDISCNFSEATTRTTLSLLLSHDISANTNVDELVTKSTLGAHNGVKIAQKVQLTKGDYVAAVPDNIELRMSVSAVLLIYRILGELDGLTLGQLDELTLYDCTVIIRN